MEKIISKVDVLIETLAESITESIRNNNEIPGDIERKTKALAELVTARASCN